MRQTINFAISDEGNCTTVNEWLATTDGKFKVSIDDDGHKYHQIETSSDILFSKALLPGGAIF